jgi:hypothetical protein
VLKEVADAESYAEHHVEEGEGGKKVRRRVKTVSPDAVGGAAAEPTSAPAPAPPSEEEEWVDDSFLKRAAPKSWEDELDIDNI